MDALIVYPENDEQLTALKAVMKAMKITFQQKREAYPDYDQWRKRIIEASGRRLANSV